MYHKQIDLLNLMQERNISIMCLTETWLNDSINSKELIFEDYEFFRSDRESKRGGGVGILINKNIQGSFKSCLKKDFIEILKIEIRLPFQKPIIIFNVYRPPNS